ncbi:aminopeptidase Q [Rhineura floridana]|uniref:aminopeptidase Q n=1 Tax=Rhineura floridana TaxID=261503 RepID=UPI002AC80B54|nr:aminopeptidase Q [Rhineura floridana]
MRAKLRSGFYLGKKSVVLLALLAAALLLALLVLGILYGSCAQKLKDERLRKGAEASPPTPSANTSAGPSALPPGPWDDWRLPANLLPLHYSLLLWPHLAPGLPEPRTYSGQVNITVRCRQETATVLLHGVGLAYQSAAVWGAVEEPRSTNGSRSIPVAELWQVPQNEYVVLELRENLSAGALYELQFSFQGRIYPEPDFQGLFLNTYKDEGESRWLVASHLEPTDARRVYPCFDEPAMKSTFNISIVHHPSYVALSNMPAIDVYEYKGVNESILSTLSNGTTTINWTVTTFERTPKMSTYITTFVVCNFDYVTTTERGNEIRIWARKDAIRNGFTEYALNITGPIFSFMEDLLNVSYPLSKTDLIALPDMGAGAMENWGLMTFQETSLLYRPQDKFTGTKIWIGQIVSHEIGHQWFGNLVTMNWWNDLWLNEGFASYLEYLGVCYIKPTVPLDEVFSFHVVLPMLTMDDEIPNQSLSDTDEERQSATLIDLFSAVTYKKGASIIRMLSSFVTERLFIKALNSFLNAFSFSNAVQDDLWNHIQKVIDEQNDLQLPAPVKVIMDSWTCQYGFPLLTVNLSTGNISQEHFFSEKRKNKTNNMWMIPISWIRSGTVQPLVWLDKRSKIFPEMKISDSEHDWIILNVNMTGYYRINYDQTHWRRLAKVLENDPKAIPVVNRLQLMADAFQLRRSGYTEYNTPLYLTKYLEKEDDILVWNMALSELEVYNWGLIWNDYELYPVLKKYILPRISPIYHHYAYLLRQSFEVLEADFHTLRIENILKTACWFGLRDCLDLASEIFTKWMNDPSHQVPVFISKTIHCYGIQVGSEKEWDFAWKIYKENDTRLTGNNYDIFSAMSCTHEPWLLQRFLQYILNDSIISPDLVSEAIGNVANSKAGHWIAWKFVTDNWSNLYNRCGYGALYAFMDTVSTDLEVQLVQVFLNSTLETQQRIIHTDRLLRVKAEKEERKEPIIKMIKWLKENTDG